MDCLLFDKLIFSKIKADAGRFCCFKARVVKYISIILGKANLLYVGLSQLSSGIDLSQLNEDRFSL